MAQERVQKQKAKGRAEEAESSEASPNATNPELADKTDRVVADIDEVLEDQIDEELLSFMDGVMGTEEEAVTMVAQFVQMGGQ